MNFISTLEFLGHNTYIPTPAPLPDLSIRSNQSAAGAWLGENVRNSDGAAQTLERVADSSHVARGQIKLSVTGATAGQTVTWSVPDWNAFSAEGWSAKFYDAPTGGTDISAQITGAGWTTTHAAGSEPIIAWEISAPAEASDATRVLSVRAQIGNGASDVVKASVRVLANVRPDVAISALYAENVAGDWIGRGELSPIAQRLQKVGAVGETHNFAVEITNTGAQATPFLLSWPQLAEGWTVQFFDALEGGTLLESDPTGLITPSIAPGQSLIWRAQVTGNVSALRASLTIRASAADLFDEVELDVAAQSLVGIQWSRDGETWTDVTAQTKLQSLRYGSIGFRGVKAIPEVGWPGGVLGPTWQWQDATLKGEKVWISPRHVTDAAGEAATATLGPDGFSSTIFVLPDVDLYLRAARGVMSAGATVAISIKARDENKAPLTNLRVRLRSIKNGAGDGHFADQPSGELFLLTDAQGNINTTWTADATGRTRLSVEAVDSADAVFGEGDTWNMEVTN